MSSQIFHKRAISGIQQNNIIKLKESNLITTVSNKKHVVENDKNYNPLNPKVVMKNSNSKIKSQNKSSQKTTIKRSVSPISSSKEEFINNYINKKLNLDKNDSENKSKSKDKLVSSNQNVTNKPINSSFNQKNVFLNKSNQNTINTTSTSLSQRSNQIPKSHRDNNSLSSKTIETEVIQTIEKYNLTTEGSNNNHKRLTLFNGSDALTSIEKIVKQSINNSNNRKKPSKSPINGTNSIDLSNRSNSPALKNLPDKTTSIKKNVSTNNNTIARTNELKSNTTKGKTISSDTTKRTCSPFSQSINSNSKSPINNLKNKSNSKNYNINLLNESKQEKKQVINSNSKELKIKDLGSKFNTISPKEMNNSPILSRKKSNEVSNEKLKKQNVGGVKTNQTSSNQLKQDHSAERSKSADKKTKSVKLMYEVTRTGFTGQEQKKVNQDSYFIYKNFNNVSDSFFVAVCDGHGSVGHDVSSFLKENLPKTLDIEVKKSSKNNIPLNKTIKDVFLSVNCKLFNEAGIDTHFSGSTCVSLIYTKEKLVCANVGDSRAVLGRYVNGVWKSQNLSRDHKPNDDDELQRINNRNGRVEPFRDENGDFIGPSRVWLMEHNIPGLAMSRSFGDKTAAQVGVISEPEIMEWPLGKDDMFIILASDGVWEFIDSDESVNMVKDYYVKNDIVGAAEFLANESTRRWRKEEDVVDDITVVLIFLEN